MNPYTILNVNKEDLEMIKQSWMFFTKSTEEDYQKLVGSAQTDDEKREIVLDQLIEVQYQNYYDGASKFVKGKLPNDASLAQREQAIKERRDLLKQCYDMICTRQKREEYEKMKENGEVEQTKKIVPMTSKKEIIQAQIENCLKQGVKTKAALSKERLKEIEAENKSRLDSKNQFPEFSGSLLGWGVMMNNEELVGNTCFLDETNEKGERVFAAILGTFQYERLKEGPTEENPKGKYGKEVLDGISVIGVTKSNAEGEVLKNDIMVARFNQVQSEEEKDFLKNVYFSDEIIEQANRENEGFMGEVVRGRDGHFEIQCNEFGDGDVVSALRLANYEKGQFYMMRNNRLWDYDDITFPKVKERLASFQLTYQEAIPKAARKNLAGKSIQNFQGQKGEDDVWAK